MEQGQRREGTAPRRGVPRAATFLLSLAVGLWLFLVLNQFRPLLPRPYDISARVATAVVLLVLALLARPRKRYEELWPVLFALFTACVAISVDRYLTLGQRVFPLFGISAGTPAAYAIDKLGGASTIVILVLAPVLLSGDSVASLRIRKGRLRLGLLVGLGTFVAAAVTAIPVSTWLFGARDLTPGRVLPWIPWVTVFVAANAANEELLFRGLFLGRLEPLLGRFASNLVIALPFTLFHSGVPYASDVLLFIAFLLPLGLAWGWLMQKTESVWGSILFHAGMDVPVILGILSA